MKIGIELQDECRHIADAIVADTKDQNPDSLEQVCRQFVVKSYSQIMMNIPLSTMSESTTVA